MLSPETLHLAQLLLTYEAVAGKTSEPTDPAAFCVYEKLRRPLCALAGVAGFRSLVFRALTLAKAEVSNLGAVQVTEEADLHGLAELEPHSDGYGTGEGGVVLIAKLLELLLTFIGESLTMRLLKDIWPDAAFEDGHSGPGREV